MAAKVTVEGTDRLARKLRSLPAHIREAAEAAVGAEAEEIADDMRRGAPVLTGELKAGIQAEHDGLEGRAVSTARHSDFVEHGTSKTPEQPFARPAAEASRQRFPGRMREVLGEHLKDLR